MDQPKYRIEIFWSDEDGGYIANVPDLRYCSAFGETYEEALREVLVAMELHLNTLREEGRPIPEPGSRRGVGVSTIVLDSGQAVELTEEAGGVSAQLVDEVGEVVGSFAVDVGENVRATAEDVSSSVGSITAITPREREVLQLLAEGKTNREIAEHLSISYSTVRLHLDRVMKALGVLYRGEDSTAERPRPERRSR